MSGESTGQVLGATTSTSGIAILPATGDSTLLQAVTIVLIVAGVLILSSFTAARIYKSTR